MSHLTATEVDLALRAADPLDGPDSDALDAAHLAGAAALFASRRVHGPFPALPERSPLPARRTRRWVLRGAGAVAVAGAAAAVTALLPDRAPGAASLTSRAYGHVPPLPVRGELTVRGSARAALLTLAAHAQDLPTAAPADVFAADDWGMWIDVGADGVGHVSLTATRHTVTAAPDGTLSGLDERLDTAGAPTGPVTRTITAPGGRMFPGQLSADPDTLLGQLTVGHPIGAHGTGELIAALADLHREWRPGPGVRAAVLRLLADRDFFLTDHLTDRAGRAGFGIGNDNSAGGLPTRQLLLFDSADGSLLGTESILTTSRGALDIHLPFVTRSTVYYPGVAPATPYGR